MNTKWILVAAGIAALAFLWFRKGILPDNTTPVSPPPLDPIQICNIGVLNACPGKVGSDLVQCQQDYLTQCGVPVGQVPGGGCEWDTVTASFSCPGVTPTVDIMKCDAWFAGLTEIERGLYYTNYPVFKEMYQPLHPECYWV